MDCTVRLGKQSSESSILKPWQQGTGQHDLSKNSLHNLLYSLFCHLVVVTNIKYKLKQLFQEKEEADMKAREEAERKQQELEEKLKREEEERSARKKRIEEIMARTRKGKDNGGGGGATTPTSSTPKKVSVHPLCSALCLALCTNFLSTGPG